MRNNLVSSALLSLLFLAFSAALWAEDAGTYPITWDENATAESLGLEPLVLPDDLYPVYPWDQVYWSKNFMNDPAKGYVRMAECDFSVPAFVEEKDLPDAKRAGFRNILLAMGTGKIDLLDAKQE